jgi:T5SS/PEP-CTERM-associated repeat protein
MKTTIPFLIACLSLLLGSVSTAQAANTIDPNSTGATDVVQDPDGSATTLTNILADPLNLGGDDLAVGNTGSGELRIDLGSSVTNAFGSIGRDPNSTGVVTVIDPNSLWDNSNHLYVGDGGDGTLNIQNGGTVTNEFGYIGYDPNSTGTVTVTDLNSTWTNTGRLYVGNSGEGILNIENGGTVTSGGGDIGRSFNSTGTVTVTDPNSTWTNSSFLFIGFSGGDGTLNIQNGGTVSNVAGFIGINSNSTGTATVAGPGSTWTNTGRLVVGEGGDGTLNIENGGTVTNSNEGYIGLLSTSTSMVTVDGAGSTWTNTGLLIVGRAGEGTLNIQNGGTVSNPAGFIGRDPNSTGSVTVDGAGSTWTNTGDLYLGGSGSTAGGTASLDVTGGGLVEVGGKFKIWTDGTVILNGGALIVDQSLSLTSGSSLTALSSSVSADTLTTDGLVLISGGTLTTTSGLTNNDDLVLVNATVEGSVNNTSGSTVTVLGTVDFNGLVTGPGNFYGPGTANFNGGMALGASPAEVSFGGSVALGASNTLFVEIGGLVPGDDFDSLVIAGTAALDGVLDVLLIDSFTPSLGDTFDIITASGGVTGTFDSTLLPDLGSLLAMDVLYGTNNVALAVVPALDGDFDLNGQVDGFDFLTWQRDPTIGSLADWEANYGMVAPLVASSATVPEPTTCTLALAALCLAVSRRRIAAR